VSLKKAWNRLINLLIALIVIGGLVIWAVVSFKSNRGKPGVAARCPACGKHLRVILEED